MNKEITGVAGELTPHFDARTDHEKYGLGCRHLENMFSRKYGTRARRPGTVFVTNTIDMDSIFESLVVYENMAVAFENLVVSTLEDTATNQALMPEFVCYENEILCYENTPVVISETAVLSSDMVCYENKVMFYENE